MRDGQFIIYHVQHLNSKGRWDDSDPGNFLFDDTKFTYEERRGAKGDSFREILHPRHDCWQVSGIHGYLNLSDVQEALAAVREVHPDRKFRMVRRFVCQMTEVVV